MIEIKLIVALAALSGFFFSTAWRPLGLDERVLRRLRTLAEGTGRLSESLPSRLRRVYAGALKILSLRLKPWLSPHYASLLRHLSAQSAAHRDPGEIFAEQVVWSALGGLSAQAVGSSFLLTAVGLAAGWLLPLLFLQRGALRRQHRLQKEFPAVLDLLTVIMEAGLDFDCAVAQVVQTGKGLLREELERMQRERRLGKTRQEALRALAERCPVAEVRSFALAIIQADRTGTSVAQVLRVLTAQVWMRRSQRAQERALRAPVKLLFPLVFCLFPAILIVLLGPLFLPGRIW